MPPGLSLALNTKKDSGRQSSVGDNATYFPSNNPSAAETASSSFWPRPTLLGQTIDKEHGCHVSPPAILLSAQISKSREFAGNLPVTQTSPPTLTVRQDGGSDPAALFVSPDVPQVEDDFETSSRTPSLPISITDCHPPPSPPEQSSQSFEAPSTEPPYSFVSVIDSAAQALLHTAADARRFELSKAFARANSAEEICPPRRGGRAFPASDPAPQPPPSLCRRRSKVQIRLSTDTRFPASRPASFMPKSDEKTPESRQEIRRSMPVHQPQKHWRRRNEPLSSSSSSSEEQEEQSHVDGDIAVTAKLAAAAIGLSALNQHLRSKRLNSGERERSPQTDDRASCRAPPEPRPSRSPNKQCPVPEPRVSSCSPDPVLKDDSRPMKVLPMAGTAAAIHYLHKEHKKRKEDEAAPEKTEKTKKTKEDESAVEKSKKKEDDAAPEKSHRGLLLPQASKKAKPSQRSRSSSSSSKSSSSSSPSPHQKRKALLGAAVLATGVGIAHHTKKKSREESVNPPSEPTPDPTPDPTPEPTPPMPAAHCQPCSAPTVEDPSKEVVPRSNNVMSNMAALIQRHFSRSRSPSRGPQESGQLTPASPTTPSEQRRSFNPFRRSRTASADAKENAEPEVTGDSERNSKTLLGVAAAAASAAGAVAATHHSRQQSKTESPSSSSVSRASSSHHHKRKIAAAAAVGAAATAAVGATATVGAAALTASAIHKHRKNKQNQSVDKEEPKLATPKESRYARVAKAALKTAVDRFGSLSRSLSPEPPATPVTPSDKSDQAPDSNRRLLPKLESNQEPSSADPTPKDIDVGAVTEARKENCPAPEKQHRRRMKAAVVEDPTPTADQDGTSPADACHRAPKMNRVKSDQSAANQPPSSSAGAGKAPIKCSTSNKGAHKAMEDPSKAATITLDVPPAKGADDACQQERIHSHDSQNTPMSRSVTPASVLLHQLHQKRESRKKNTLDPDPEPEERRKPSRPKKGSALLSAVAHRSPRRTTSDAPEDTERKSRDPSEEPAIQEKGSKKAAAAAVVAATAAAISHRRAKHRAKSPVQSIPSEDKRSRSPSPFRKVSRGFMPHIKSATSREVAHPRSKFKDLSTSAVMASLPIIAAGATKLHDEKKKMHLGQIATNPCDCTSTTCRPPSKDARARTPRSAKPHSPCPAMRNALVSLGCESLLPKTPTKRSVSCQQSVTPRAAPLAPVVSAEQHPGCDQLRALAAKPTSRKPLLVSHEVLQILRGSPNETPVTCEDLKRLRERMTRAAELQTVAEARIENDRRQLEEIEEALLRIQREENRLCWHEEESDKRLETFQMLHHNRGQESITKLRNEAKRLKSLIVEIERKVADEEAHEKRRTKEEFDLIATSTTRERESIRIALSKLREERDMYLRKAKEMRERIFDERRRLDILIDEYRSLEETVQRLKFQLLHFGCPHCDTCEHSQKPGLTTCEARSGPNSTAAIAAATSGTLGMAVEERKLQKADAQRRKRKNSFLFGGGRSRSRSRVNAASYQAAPCADCNKQNSPQPATPLTGLIRRWAH
eukprot:Blabericola_migrator_1__2386@NODE_166_length_12211_cov_61_370142_g144_i0_p1_GENE_NODE_166_length_12211_cov_61_370142_g144_i0NODE_166_length_12211_cov_61_370142_g144_i0_p1_ORF_typecomplete_len1532_score257_57Trp_oprn_chp/PF09534_10/1_2e03Trp_oprn_chp/PF09534_10/3_9e03Trp_oprn_chp/PF09534_10/0_025Trp_oprn_chp/PF09534_10/1_4e02SfLAP/PF11139_8/1_6e03SfLAP/PF11139_8/5_2SfLAP/PF11139_8/2_5e02Mid2/PF04478_12/29Mid2/PF04478_12/1_7e03Mid2/PF04478_12/12_NODE_166_length_12211_cov_61_370142_g144_i034418036